MKVPNDSSITPKSAQQSKIDDTNCHKTDNEKIINDFALWSNKDNYLPMEICEVIEVSIYFLDFFFLKKKILIKIIFFFRVNVTFKNLTIDRPLL